jgi:RNA polymerase sigma factor (sigma-70 family)
MLDGLRARDPLPRTVRRAQKGLGADSDGIAPPSGILLVDLDHALGLPADDSEGPEEVAVEADLRRRVRDALPLLPPRDRQVLVWRYILGRTLRDTAEHLALSATRTIEIQERALQRLRRYLDGQPMLLDRRRRSMRTPAPFVSARPEQEAGGRDANRRSAPQGERVS